MEDDKKKALMESISKMHQANAQNTQNNVVQPQDNTTIKYQDGYYEEVSNNTQSQQNTSQINTPQDYNSIQMVNNSQPILNNQETAEGKPKMSPERKKRLISSIVSVVLVIIGVVIAVISSRPTEQVFTKLEMQITLTDEFSEDTSYFNYLTVYESADLAVFVNREEFSELTDLGLEISDSKEYLELLAELEDIDELVLLDSAVNAYFIQFTDAVNGVEYYYKAYVFASESAYWTIQFACKESERSSLADDIVTYASSVKMDAVA